MYPASKNVKTFEEAITFPFKRKEVSSRPGPVQLKPILKNSRSSTKGSTPRVSQPPTNLVYGRESSRFLSERRPDARHLVVRMPSVVYPRGVSPPPVATSSRDAAQPAAQKTTAATRATESSNSANNEKRATVLPPISSQTKANTNENMSNKQTADTPVSQTDTHYLYAPLNTPLDIKYESGEPQGRPSVDRPLIKVTYRKPTNMEDEGRRAGARTAGASIQKDQGQSFGKLRYANKHSSLCNSWEQGLHNYHLQEDSSDDDEQLTFRFKIKMEDDEESKPKSKTTKRPKTPPKDPFKDGILQDLDNRRKVKVRDAVAFLESGDTLQGKRTATEMPNDSDFCDIRRGSQGFRRFHQLNLPGTEYSSAGLESRCAAAIGKRERGSGIFLKKPDLPSVKRPFEQPTSDLTPRLLTGKTVLRNPLSPVPLKHRYNPVVVMKSKLEDYENAIKEFLEQVVEEQRMSAYSKEPLPLTQSVDNMVIYQDFDTIQYFKAMQNQLKVSQSHSKGLQKAQQYNFKAPASNVARGMARVQKLGALNPSEQLEPLPKSGLKSRAVAGRSVFLTNPETTQMLGEPSALQRMIIASGLATPTLAPPNTPFIAQ